MQFYVINHDSSPDINECSSPNLHTCPPNSKCKNTPTGYECECLDGFMKNGSKCEGELKVLSVWPLQYLGDYAANSGHDC